MEIAGKRVASRNAVFSTFPNSVWKRWSTYAVIVPVMIVPVQEIIMMIAVFLSPSRTFPSIKAVL